MRSLQLAARVWLLLGWTVTAAFANPFRLEVRQITRGPQHHFFGYIGQSLTCPWNASGRYLLALRTRFHDRMPRPGERADVVLIDTQDGYRVEAIERTRAWNFQQGTMFYWHPRHPDTQFFFNDRDPETHRVFTVLYDIAERRRLREFRFDDPPVANGGVSPRGDFFLAINYGRMARCRPVTGYPGAADPTASLPAPGDDGIFRIDIETGERTLLVSFRELRDLVKPRYEGVDLERAEFYINHTLVNRGGELVYFFTRATHNGKSMAVNVPCSIKADGSRLTDHAYIGGHPEWDIGSVVIGADDDRQVRYDVHRREIVGQIGDPRILPRPGGDIALSPDANWFVCGYSVADRSENRFVVVRRSDAAHATCGPLSRGPYRRGPLRIDPAPRFNRDQTAILVPGVTSDGTRHLHLIEIK